MSPFALAAIWLATGLAAAVVLPPLRRRRLGWIAPAAAGVCGLGAASTGGWPGPAATTAFGASLNLGRPGLGLLVVGGIALGVAMLLAPRIDGGEVLSAGVIGAASVVLLSTAVPIVWSLAVAIAIGALVIRWIAASPGRTTIAAGRVAGMGAAALIGAAGFLPGAGFDTGVGLTPGTRATLSGGLLAAGLVALLGLVPAGGWAAAATSAVRGVDLAPWALLLAPALLLSAAALLPALPAKAQTPLAHTLLVLGLASAVFGGAQALRSSPSSRYGRVLLGDVALVAAGLGSGHPTATLGLYVLVVTHLCAGPLLIHAERAVFDRPRRLAWLALTGLPPSPAFWGRFLVFEALAATSGLALILGLLAGAALLSAVVHAVVRPGDADPDSASGSAMVRVVAWLVAIAAVAVGFAPGAIAGHIFGVDA
jgi:hypothetical protein